VPTQYPTSLMVIGLTPSSKKLEISRITFTISYGQPDLRVKSVGKLYAGKPHVRVDEALRERPIFETMAYKRHIDKKLLWIHNNFMNKETLSLLRAWVRYDEAVSSYNKELRSEFDVSGLQLAILRIAAERSPQRMKELRGMLSLHPATLGQAVDSLVNKGLLERFADQEDARGKVIRVTPQGNALIAEAPLAGPVRLRYVAEDPERLRRLADALEELVDLFGLTEWTIAKADAAPRRKGD